MEAMESTDKEMRRWIRLVEEGPSMADIVVPKVRRVVVNSRDRLMGYVVGICFVIEAFRRGKL